jgi:hypothetical protein
MWKPARALRVSREDQERLETLIRSSKTPQRVALRARMVLAVAEGRRNHALAKELGISRPTLLLWRQRYADAGVTGLLKDAPRPGRTKRADRPGDGEVRRLMRGLVSPRGRSAPGDRGQARVGC